MAAVHAVSMVGGTIVLFEPPKADSP